MSDAIKELRDYLAKSPSMVYPQDVLEYLPAIEAENAKLRELVMDWRALAVYGEDSLSDWIEIQADLESRMRELGVWV